jgi:hypothetical protein
MFAFGQQSPLQQLNDSLLGEANFHAAFNGLAPTERLGPVRGDGAP